MLGLLAVGFVAQRFSRRLVLLDELPTRTSGKVDRNAFYGTGKQWEKFLAGDDFQIKS